MQAPSCRCLAAWLAACSCRSQPHSAPWRPTAPNYPKSRDINGLTTFIAGDANATLAALNSSGVPPGISPGQLSAQLATFASPALGAVSSGQVLEVARRIGALAPSG